MNVEIISIGDELLIGQTINTNAAWMGQELNMIGIDVQKVSVISDHQQAITNALDDALNRVEVVLMTGGLGPTKDDITKDTLVEYFQTRLIENPDVLQGIKSRLKARNLDINTLNKQQALVPENARIFLNKWGTAPGMLFEHNERMVISLPGVPTEMKGLMTHFVLPELQSRFNPGFVIHRTILTIGEIEARLAERLEGFEDHLPKGVKLAYLPTSPIIKLRFSARGRDKESLNYSLENAIKDLYTHIPELIFDEEPGSMQETVGTLLKKFGKTLATAESCTGGNIASSLVSIPGSSDYYLGSVIAYANDIKINTLGIDPYLIEKEGSVSKKVVSGMCHGIQQKYKADYVIAVSGIAGPDGGTPDKPVGTTWFGIGTPKGIYTYKFNFGNDRNQNIHRATITGLNLLRKHILEEYGGK